jgi:hypothetical protein
VYDIATYHSDGEQLAIFMHDYPIHATRSPSLSIFEPPFRRYYHVYPPHQAKPARGVRDQGEAAQCFVILFFMLYVHVFMYHHLHQCRSLDGVSLFCGVVLFFYLSLVWFWKEGCGEEVCFGIARERDV